MCKTNMKIDFCYVNICKNEIEKKYDKAMVQNHALRLVFNRLKEMKSLIFIYALLGT
jgi:hypothetical protein